MKELFDQVSIRCSEVTTRTYSTSFTIGIKCLAPSLRNPIYAIYGYVRLADEIVDSFHGFDRAKLLERLRTETLIALKDGISLNPILNSFQEVVRRCHIEYALIDRFLLSMEMDLKKISYNQAQFDDYILGSAEVVGLMCLRVFTADAPELFDKLKPYAMRLGAAFQKINFLRDIRADYVQLGRTYFPNVEITDFNEAQKRRIEADIRDDFDQALKGILLLPRSSRLGVYVAYCYYQALFNKIRNTPSRLILNTRIRIDALQKLQLLAYAALKHQLRLI
ncbi:MAG: phytoene/squalene synthase family protein [Chryseolinea sp.]